MSKEDRIERRSIETVTPPGQKKRFKRLPLYDTPGSMDLDRDAIQQRTEYHGRFITALRERIIARAQEHGAPFHYGKFMRGKVTVDDLVLNTMRSKVLELAGRITLDNKALIVVAYPRKWFSDASNLPIPPEDLVAIGLESMLEASYDFDPVKGQFSPFAVNRMRWAVSRQAQEWESNPQGVHGAVLTGYMRKAEEWLIQREQRVPRKEEVAFLAYYAQKHRAKREQRKNFYVELARIQEALKANGISLTLSQAILATDYSLSSELKGAIPTYEQLFDRPGRFKIRLPKKVREVLSQRSQLASLSGFNVSLDELVSIDTETVTGQETTVQVPRRDLIVAPNEDRDLPFMQADVRELLGILSPTERGVIERRYGLEDGEEQTQEEVGQVLGVSRGRVSQIEAKAIRALRHPTRVRKMRVYLR